MSLDRASVAPSIDTSFTFTQNEDNDTCAFPECVTMPTSSSATTEQIRCSTPLHEVHETSPNVSIILDNSSDFIPLLPVDSSASIDMHDITPEFLFNGSGVTVENFNTAFLAITSAFCLSNACAEAFLQLFQSVLPREAAESIQKIRTHLAKPAQEVDCVVHKSTICTR